MDSRLLQHTVRWLFGLCLLALGNAASAAAPALVSLLQGEGTLVRQTTRYALTEGVALADGDIVETAADAFLQIEFEDGTLVAMSEKGRLLLKPQITPPKTTSAPAQFYLLEGWIKLTTVPKPPAEFAFLTPAFEFVTPGATIVARVRAKSYELFVESGSGRLIAQGATTGLKADDFVNQAANVSKPTTGASLGGEFLQLLPRQFRDRLPARAALFTGRIVTPKPVGPIAYADVSAWLHAEPGVRLALSRQWRSRAADRAFRAEVAANLSAHTEWERVLYPERFLPKKPPPPAMATARPVPRPANNTRASTAPPMPSPVGQPDPAPAPVTVSPAPESPASSPN